MHEAIRTTRPDIRKVGDRVTLSCEVEHSDLPTSLWFEFPSSYAEHLCTQRADWVFASLLIPAMVRGAKLVSPAGISSKLYYSMNGDLQYILKSQDRRLHRISVIPEEISEEGVGSVGEAVGTGFSAGVDSFCTIMDLSDADVPESHRLTHLTVINCGAMGNEKDAELLFHKYADRVAQYSQERGLMALTVNSNLADFYGDFSFEGTHTIRNASSILAISGLFRRYYYSSTFEYSKTFVGPTYDMAYADPVILPHLSTEQTEFVSAGSRYSRLQKAIKVSEFRDSYKYLDVCVDRASARISREMPNCSICWKCGRHILTLDCLDKLREYASVFDIERYRRHRHRILAEILKSAYLKNQPNDLDVVELARNSGKFRLPSDRILSVFVRHAPSKLIRLATKLNDKLIP